MRHPDQAVAAAGDVVGVAGEVVDEEVAGARPLAGQPAPHDRAGAGLGDRDVRLVRGSARRRWRRPARRAPPRGSPSRPGAAAGPCGWPGRSRPSTARCRTAWRSRRTTRCRRWRWRRCCRRPSARPATRSATSSIAPVAVSTRSTPRRASQTSRRPSRSSSMPEGAAAGVRRPGRCAGRRGLTRKMLPSSVPVKTAPSSGPCVPTTTSSAPFAGTGTTSILRVVVTGTSWRTGQARRLIPSGSGRRGPRRTRR